MNTQMNTPCSGLAIAPSLTIRTVFQEFLIISIRNFADIFFDIDLPLNSTVSSFFPSRVHRETEPNCHKAIKTTRAVSSRLETALIVSQANVATAAQKSPRKLT
ncbi:MAG TPA: hypothetical protein VFW00_07985 [Rhodocyclaceae bacterium]|nr:hypothetical protein [Rhodocyclaceae bacterium]